FEGVTITLLEMATAIALGIYLVYFPYEEGFQYLAFIQWF
ncbi:hypothetical protein Tco_0632271, partial [Tanacetum coccineum]